MIKAEKRKAIYNLHNEGMSIREIARLLKVNRRSVRTVINQKGEMPEVKRRAGKPVPEEVLTDLYKRCEGRIQRMHEILQEDMGFDIGYSTLSQRMRELGFGKRAKKRCARVPDEPGEMQHDTSEYVLTIGGKKTKVIASLLYFRYSKIRYLEFYTSFNRFKMQCFFYKALCFLGYCGHVCIIDNTNLARLRGSGSNAVIVAEMEQFTAQFGFEYICHAIGHSNRKAGDERGFYTIETNFFPGRSFDDMQDLNNQALQWATVRMKNRPVSKTGLIPAKAWEHEQRFLTKIPPYVSPPYLEHQRCTDQYGYISFAANYYWVPGIHRENVVVLQYCDYIEIYLKRKLLYTYPLLPEAVKNKRIAPKGHKPVHAPKSRKKPSAEEEEKLRLLGDEVNTYLDFVLKQSQRKNHQFIIKLYYLYQKLAPELFIKTIKRASRYRITNMDVIERIAILQMKRNIFDFSDVELDENFRNRQTYQQGCFADEVDLSIYDEEDQEEDNG
mgnify:CR=1 FL=1